MVFPGYLFFILAYSSQFLYYVVSSVSINSHSPKQQLERPANVLDSGYLQIDNNIWNSYLKDPQKIKKIFPPMKFMPLHEFSPNLEAHSNDLVFAASSTSVDKYRSSTMQLQMVGVELRNSFKFAVVRNGTQCLKSKSDNPKKVDLVLMNNSQVYFKSDPYQTPDAELQETVGCKCHYQRKSNTIVDVVVKCAKMKSEPLWMSPSSFPGFNFSWPSLS